MSTTSLSPDILEKIAQVATDAAIAAGKLIASASENLSSLNVEQKTMHDYVSEVDKNSEAMIFGYVANNFPDHAFVGEEFGSKGEQHSEITWVVDPLDGTTNFLRGIPHFSVSMAVLVGERIEYAVIYDPIKKDLFTASLGGGAYLNGREIHVSDCQSIHGGLLATGVPFSGQLLEDLSCFTATMEGMLAHGTSGIRRLGSAALDLAYVAAGRYDGYWEAGLKPWDIAAGILIVREAGGQVADFVGANSCLQTGDIVAASPGLMTNMINITSECYANKSI